MEKWISINDKQPEEGKRVLLAVTDFPIRKNREYYLCVGAKFRNDFVPSGFHLDDDDVNDMMRGDRIITHWMSLPEPPEKKTLHLNLKRKWFEMILKGDKKEEYRDFSNYWIDRLTSPYPNDPKRRSLKQYDTITFSNGYAKDRDQFVIEFKGMKISQGNPLWGAKPLKEYFCIQLGNIISKSIK